MARQDTPALIAETPWLVSMIESVEAYLDGQDQGLPLMSLIDIVPSEALIHLARQFRVMGNRGWNLVSTDAERRVLIKTAVELHRYKGTPFSVIDALRRVGYPDAEVIEASMRSGATHNGTYNFNGAIQYGGGYVGAWHWTEFIVRFPYSGSNPLIDADQRDLILALITEYKALRSNLLYIEPSLTQEERITVTASMAIGYYVFGALIFTFNATTIMVVDQGLANIAQAMGGTANKAIDTWGVGTDGTTPAAGDSGLTGGLTKGVTSVSYPSTGTVEYKVDLLTTEANGITLQELGLFSQDGTLDVRAVFPGIPKNNTINLSGTITLSFSR